MTPTHFGLLTLEQLAVLPSLRVGKALQAEKSALKKQQALCSRYARVQEKSMRFPLSAVGSV